MGTRKGFLVDHPSRPSCPDCGRDLTRTVELDGVSPFVHLWSGLVRCLKPAAS